MFFLQIYLIKKTKQLQEGVDDSRVKIPPLTLCLIFDHASLALHYYNQENKLNKTFDYQGEHSRWSLRLPQKFPPWVEGWIDIRAISSWKDRLKLHQLLYIAKEGSAWFLSIYVPGRIIILFSEWSLWNMIRKGVASKFYQVIPLVAKKNHI